MPYFIYILMMLVFYNVMIKRMILTDFGVILMLLCIIFKCHNFLYFFHTLGVRYGLLYDVNSLHSNDVFERHGQTPNDAF